MWDPLFSGLVCRMARSMNFWQGVIQNLFLVLKQFFGQRLNELLSVGQRHLDVCTICIQAKHYTVSQDLGKDCQLRLKFISITDKW